MLWTNSVDIEVIEFNSNMIAVEIIEGTCKWTLVGFYGPPQTAKRKVIWEDLSALLESLKNPWVCFGDFNMIINDEEKVGGQVGSSSAATYLKEILFDLGAIDLGFAGNKFTWSNKRWGRHAIRERLDRGIASMNWRIAFLEATIFHLGTVKSDHCPFLLDTWPSNESNPRPFRFVAAWTRDHRCADVVEQAWKKNCNGSMCLRLQRKQQNTKSALKKWNKDVFGHYQKRINDITEQLQKIQHKDCIEENYKSEVMLQSEMNEWLLRSEMLWRQKSREMWLKDGDRNSKFFHLSTLIR